MPANSLVRLRQLGGADPPAPNRADRPSLDRSTRPPNGAAHRHTVMLPAADLQ